MTGKSSSYNLVSSPHSQTNKTSNDCIVGGLWSSGIRPQHTPHKLGTLKCYGSNSSLLYYTHHFPLDGNNGDESKFNTPNEQWSGIFPYSTSMSATTYLQSNGGSQPSNKSLLTLLMRQVTESWNETAKEWAQSSSATKFRTMKAPIFANS